MDQVISKHDNSGWFGIDLDGTWVKFDGWQGIDHIGEIIEPIDKLVRALLAAGAQVRCFTARASEEDPIQRGKFHTAWRAWSRKNYGQYIPYTCIKDCKCIMIIDDRAVQIEHNTGRIVGDPSLIATWTAMSLT